MKHPIQQMMDQRREGKICGIESVCSANGFVLEVALKRSKLFNAPVPVSYTHLDVYKRQFHRSYREYRISCSGCSASH